MLYHLTRILCVYFCAVDTLHCVHTVAAFGGQDRELDKYRETLEERTPFAISRGRWKGVMEGSVLFLYIVVVGTLREPSLRLLLFQNPQIQIECTFSASQGHRLWLAILVRHMVMLYLLGIYPATYSLLRCG